jgi:predicted nucleic acid-binding protein
LNTFDSCRRVQHREKEKVPWGDCIVAATAARNKARFVVTEDTHLMEIKEIEARRTSELRL